METKKKQPVITLKEGFLRSFENNVAVIRALGLDTQIKIFPASPERNRTPLTILLENVRGHEVHIERSSGSVQNIIRSERSIMFDVGGHSVQKIGVSYPHHGKEFDFLFFGDVHGMFHNLQTIIQKANSQNPLFVMSNGDMTHSGRLSDYHTLSDILGQSNVPVFTSIGNHDKRARGGRAAYRKLLGPFYYSFSVHDSKFIVLDSSRKRGLQKFQYKWLERELQLAQQQKQRIFVFLHRPPICPKYNYLAFSASSNAWQFMSMMGAYNVEMVFASHIHVFSEFYKRGVRYIVTGGGGGALWQAANVYHYLHVFVKKDGVDVRMIQLPTPEGKMSQRIKDVIKFNVDYHITNNRRFKQVALLGTALLVSRSTSSRRFRLRRRKR